MPGVIGLASLFMLFAIEMWMHTKMPHAHSHGSATGEEFARGRLSLPPPPPPPRANLGPPSIGQASTDDDQYRAYLDEKRMIDE
jgi:hypothetical protein